MCVKLTPRDLNSNIYLSYLTNIYTYRVTTAQVTTTPRVCGGLSLLFYFQDKDNTIIEECLTKIWLILLILICHCPKMWTRPIMVVVGMTLAFKLKQLKLILHSNSTVITRSLQFLDSPHKVLTKNQYSHSLSYLGISHAFFLIWMFSLSLIIPLFS